MSARIASLARVARRLAYGVVVALALTAPAAATGCGGDDDDDGGTGPTASLCSSASFSGASIGFNLGCTSYESSISGITYDQFSRVTSYNYDIACSGGANRRSGRVFNISYNNLGEPLTWDFTVNGQTCRKS